MKTRKKIHIINKTSVRYLPKRLSFKDNKKQSKMLLKSKKMYLKGKYYTRKPVKSFKSKSVVTKTISPFQLPLLLKSIIVLLALLK